MTCLDSTIGARRILILTASVILGACGSGDGTDDSTEQARRAELSDRSSGYASLTLNDIQIDMGAMALAGELFQMHCTSCHGNDGTGEKGITDLTRGRFNYGASADAIRTTIREGRHSEMPRMGKDYGEVELGQIVAYLDTLGTTTTLDDYQARGQEFYLESCAACHGKDGRGVAPGTPDLTDDYWLHGDSMMNKRLAITRGVTSECPAGLDSLTPIEVELLTAWVLELSSS